MKNVKTLAAVGGLLLLFGSNVFATNINARQTNQQVRIAQGVASGELTVWETARLQKGQIELNRMERRAKRDGIVTKRERAALNAKANKESTKINRKKNNLQSRS